MSQYRKLTNSRLVENMIVVAHNPAKPALSNKNGVFCKVLKKVNKSFKVQVLGTNDEAVLNLDAEGAWAYDPASADTNVRVHCADFNAWPRFTPRMQAEGWQGKVFKFDASELHVDRVEQSPGFGLTLLRHRGETIDPDTKAPYTNNFLMTSILPAEAPEWRVPRAERMGIGAVELPLPPKPTSAEDNAIIEAISHIFSTLNAHKRENVSYAKFNKDFTCHKEYLNQVCHRAAQEKENFPVQYIASYGRHKYPSQGNWNKGQVVNKEAEILYITYLTGYSPYAEAFITKDPEYIMENGYILNADAPKRLVVGGLYATRQLWERPQRADGFYELYKAGVPLDAAFVFGCQTSQYDGKVMKMSETGRSHSHLNNGQLSDECILNFIDHTPKHPGEPYKKDCYASSGKSVDGMWSDTFGTKRSKIYDQLANIKGAGSWGTALSVEDVVEQASDYIDEWLTEMRG